MSAKQGEQGMHGYCGGYWIGPVLADGVPGDVCNGCGMEREHRPITVERTREMARRRRDAQQATS